MLEENLADLLIKLQLALPCWYLVVLDIVVELKSKKFSNRSGLVLEFGMAIFPIQY